jgi:hypothetical protein
MPSHRLQRTSRLTTLLGVGLQLWGRLAGIENLTASSFFPLQPSHEQRTEQPPPSNIVTASSPWHKAEQTLKSKAANTKKEKERSKVTHESEATAGKASEVSEGLQSRSHTSCVMQFSDKLPQPHIRTISLVLKRALKARRRRAEDIGVDFTRSRPRNHHTYVPTRYLLAQ